MIITQKTPDSKMPGLDVDEPPPTYSPPLEPSAAFKTKPTNFLILSNDHDSIRGEFVIDPAIHIPSSLLPPLGEDETEDDRKNLCLRSKFSSVHADVWLVGSDAPRRTTMALTSGHGSIHAQLHTLHGAAPFSLRVDAPHGTVRLALPRSFQGLISLSTRHGSVSLSDPLVQNATQLGQLSLIRWYFVGNFQLLGEEAWQGDQVEIEAAHGSIRVRYVDETVAGRGERGLFSRLFGK